jgi:hypothetical protein
MTRMALIGAVALVAACSQQGASDAAQEADNGMAAPPAIGPARDSGPKSGSPRPSDVSRFTTGGLKKCRVIEKNEDEGPYYRHRCPGVGGFNYEVIESDLRQHLVIIAPDGTRSELKLYGIGGGGFSHLGPTMDWRGRPGDPPRVLTARFNVQQGDEGGDRSMLLVIRLASPACIVGVVEPGPTQSEQARAIADRDPLPACVADPQ